MGSLQSRLGNGFVGKVILQLSLGPWRHSKTKRINSGRWIKKKQTRPSSAGTDFTGLRFRQALGDGQPQGHPPHAIDEQVWDGPAKPCHRRINQLLTDQAMYKN